MSLHSWRTLAALAAGVLVAVPAARAAPSGTVAEIATYAGADRQQMLEDGARAEGALLMYTTGTQIQPLMDRFTQKYPFIKLQLLRGGPPEVIRRYVEESNAGRNACDGFELSSDGMVEPRALGLLQPYSSPQMAAYPTTSIEPGRHWVSVRESYGGIGYNTKLVPPETAPKTWPDMLKPEFKGRMAISGSDSVAAEWAGNLMLTYGEDFLEKLGKQDIRVYQVTSRALANLVVSGEIPILARSSNAHMAEERKKGASVAWVEPGPVTVTDTGVALALKAPHPHAMMLMIDFLLSAEGQKMYQELGYNSGRSDVAGSDTPKQRVYFSNRPTYVEDFDKWQAMFRRIFQGKG